MSTNNSHRFLLMHYDFVPGTYQLLSKYAKKQSIFCIPLRGRQVLKYRCYLTICSTRAPDVICSLLHDPIQGVQVLMACAKVKLWIVVTRSLLSFPPGTLVETFPTGNIIAEERLVGDFLAGLATIQTRASVRELTMALFINDLAGKPGNSCISYACDPYN